MGAKIPSSVAGTPVEYALRRRRIPLKYRGKVRDTYQLPDQELLLVYATDRISIFDFVLPAQVHQKGALLTALTVFWLTEVLNDAPHHLVAFGKDIDGYLPPQARNNTVLHRSALVVRRLDILPVECIVRGYLTGSGWESYQRNGEVCGMKLPEGLHDGSRILPAPIFTPTTKAKTGHDEHLPAEEVVRKHGSWIRDRSLDCYQRIAAVAESKGIIFADTKLEFGNGGVLADEVGTPDSSRFWDKDAWERAAAQKKSPPSFDKQGARDWGKTLVTPVSAAGGKFGLQHLQPENPAHRKFVAALTVPQQVLDETAQRYRTVLQRLTGLTLEDFQKKKLGVA